MQINHFGTLFNNNSYGSSSILIPVSKGDKINFQDSRASGFGYSATIRDAKFIPYK